MSVESRPLHELHDAEKRYYHALHRYTAALQTGLSDQRTEALKLELHDALIALGTAHLELLSGRELPEFWPLAIARDPHESAPRH